MKKILYVVHRYAPYPGGSENHTRDLAEETLSRGHQVAVFTGEHKGDWNGVHVTSDTAIFNYPWDLVVVHGGDVGIQNLVLVNIKNLPYPVLYYIIKPSESSVCLQALNDAKWVGCGTPQDWDHVMKHGALSRSVKINLSVNEAHAIGRPGFRERYGIKTKNMFLSCGGYWPHKGMKELAKLFSILNIPDTTLVLTGYDNRHDLMPEESEFIKPLMLEDKAEVADAMKEADLYIMHSFEEGFGLVLVESMLNHTPWVARDIAGATMMKEFGKTYTNDKELSDYLVNFKRPDDEKLDNAYEYAVHNHTTKSSVDAILKLINN
jgi:glycosyltransferase involved in cell wall biosynthesis